MWGSQGPFLKKRKAMASLPHVASTESPIKHSSSLPSFNNPSMESSPTSPSCFPSTSLPEFEGHLQPAQGSWHQNPATHLEKHFDFAEGHGDGGRLLPASFASTGVDSYSNAHFTNALMASGTWDSKLSYLSAAPNSILGNPTSIAGHRQGHMHAGLDYMHAGLEHMHTEAPLRKMMPSPQPFSEIEKFLNHSNLGPLNVGVSIDPSKEGLAIQGMNLAASHCLANFSTDPGFAERAARFSSFGNLGYSEAYLTVDGGKGMNRAAKHSGHRIMPKCSAPNSPNGPNNNNNSSVQEPNNFPAKEALLTEEPKKGLEKKTSFSPTRNSIFDGSEGAQKQHCISMNDSDESMGQDVSSSCERNNGGETTPSQGIAENLGRKRKAGSKQKSKDGGGLAINPKDLDTDEGKSKWQNSGDSALEKEQKPKVEQSNSGNSGDSTPKSVKESSKPPEVPKPDFIHVRARRGQATDSHSLAERVRREKISERMKYLQDLVPGCSKVTGKAVMLDEIINYVQSLQRQVEFLSMKLAAVNPRVEFNIDNLFGRERIQPRIPLPAFVFTPENANPYPPLHPHQQPHAPLQVFGSCPPLDVHSFGSDPASRQTLSTPPSMDAYGDAVSQLSQAWDDELQSVVQMGFAQGKQTPLASPDLQGELFPGQMKVEH